MKNSEGLINFLIRTADEHEHITSKDVDALLEKIFKNPDSCAHGCDYKDKEEGDWIFSKCTRCGRSIWAHKDTIKMWRVFNEK